MTFSNPSLPEALEYCYRKLKHFVYYTNGSDFIKAQIANYEAKPDFLVSFDKLAAALENEDDSYFQPLFGEIRFRVYSKLKSSKASTETAGSGGIVPSTDEPAIMAISKVNYVIDLPLELRIVDTLWSLLFGRLLFTNPNILEHTYAYRFAYKLFDIDQQDFWQSINFESLPFFDPYYRGYKNWRQGAVGAAKERNRKGQCSTIFSLDLTRYYYNVNFSINEIITSLHLRESDVDQFGQYAYLSSIIMHIYSSFSKVISPFHQDVKENICIPIGLISSGLVANAYLFPFDKKISSAGNVVFYGRYVDDMLIVVDSLTSRSKKSPLSVHGILEKLSGYFLLCGAKNDELALADYPNLLIGKEKIHIIRIRSNHSKALLDSLNDDLSDGSQPRTVSNPDISFSDLVRYAFENQKKNSHLKIRDVEDVQADTSRLFFFISNYRNFISRIDRSSDEDKAVGAGSVAEFKDALDYQTLLSLSTRWWKLLQFAICLNDKNNHLFSFLKDTIQEAIIRLRLSKFCDASIPKNKEKRIDLLKNVKETLFYDLRVCVATSKSLRHMFSADDPDFLLISNIRESNLFDYHFVSSPLANYFDGEASRKLDFWACLPSLLSSSNSSAGFDPQKMRFSPRYIHFEEFTVAELLHGIVSPDNPEYLDAVRQNYLFLCGENSFLNSLFLISEASSLSCRKTQVIVPTINAAGAPKKCFISIGNIDLSKYHFIKSGKNHTLNFTQATFANKKVLLSVLNDLLSQKRKASDPYPWILALPEFAVPNEWLIDIAEFARFNQIGIITGLTFAKTSDNHIHNFIATILPSKDHFSYKYAFIFLREKNDYSPSEHYLFSTQRPPLIEQDTNPSDYFLFKWENIYFTVFDCYELSDLSARAEFFEKDKIPQVLFATEFNNDVPYFDDLIHSTCRDLYSYVVQVNSSHIGDSQIVFPKHVSSKIASIGGGCFSGVHTSLIDIGILKRYLTIEKNEDFMEYSYQYDQRTLSPSQKRKYKDFEYFAKTGAKRNK